MIIGLSGKAQAGKDTVGAHLVEAHGFKRLSFADALKDLALCVDPVVGAWLSPDGEATDLDHLQELVSDAGWDEAKTYPEVRRFLQNLGQGIRDLDPEFWIRQVERQAIQEMNEQQTLGPNIVITDVRYRNEADWIRTWGYVWRIERKDAGLDGDAAGHPSENDLNDYKFDGTIGNHTTIDDLHQLVDSALEGLWARDSAL